jgi:WG containing repeat
MLWAPNMSGAKYNLSLASILCILAVITSATAQSQNKQRTLFPIKDDDKYGYIDETGKVVIPLRYDFALNFSEGLSMVQLPAPSPNRRIDDPYGRFIYEKMPFGDWAVIDESGNELFKVVFKENIAQYQRDPETNSPAIGSFSEGLALVEVNYYAPNPYGGFLNTQRWGFINREGKVVIDPDFDDAHSFAEGLAAVTVEYPLDFRASKAGYIDKDGLFAIWPRFVKTRSFSEGLAAVQVIKNPPMWGYIDRTGKLQIPARFSKAEEFHEGMGRVVFQDSVLFIDKTGQMAFAPDYFYAARFSEGLAAINIGGVKNEDYYEPYYILGGKWGFIDLTGKQRIVPQYAWANKFSEGLAAVNIGGTFARNRPLSGGKWGYVDTKGELAIKARFESADDFSHGLARVTINRKMTYINKKGDIVWQSSKKDPF